MQLILAIDSDPRRSEQLATLVQARLQVDLVQAKSAGEGLLALQDRIPDLILTAPLLSPFDDGVLDEYLRDLGAAGAHVQTVRIPLLNPEPKKHTFADRLFILGRGGRNNKPSASAATPDGCDPGVFADEISTYLSRAASAKPTVAQVAQALSRHQEAMSRPQEQVPPMPPVARQVGPISDEYIAEFNDAIVTDVPVTEPEYGAASELRYVAVSEPAPIEAIEPTHGIASEPAVVDMSASSFNDVPRLGGEHVVEAMRTPEPVASPEPTRQTPDKSDTFEAALAAIRAAWVKPDATAAPESSSVVSAGPPEAEPPTTRSINGLGKTAAPDRRQTPDEWGMFDAEKCGFPALVEKLDEVAESKDATQRRSGTSTVISIR
jgi:hypothetical protein